LVPGPPLLHQLICETVQHADGDARHYHNMRYVSLASKLPPSHELHIHWPLEYHSVTELIEHGADSCVLKAIIQIICISQALLYVLLKATTTFLIQGVP
jgi:hypothetical protein